MENMVFVECNSSIEQEALLVTLDAFGYHWDGGELTGKDAYIPTLNGEALDATDIYYCIDFDDPKKIIYFIIRKAAKHAPFSDIKVLPQQEFYNLLKVNETCPEISQQPSEELSTFLDSFNVV